LALASVIRSGDKRKIAKKNWPSPETRQKARINASTPPVSALLEIEAGVVVKPGSTVGETELLAFCAREIGSFKTPRAIRFLTVLPKGPSGKTQRLRLLENRQDSSEP
jgi:acyl-CoA synthetase (AMP-forming)/AMP-acid ligase II